MESKVVSANNDLVKEIVIEGADILKNVCTPIDFPLNEEAKKCAVNLKETLKSKGGAVGLAAPQIGYPIRMVLCQNFTGNPTLMINPIIVKQSEEVKTIEGCLSIPGKSFNAIPRYKEIKVKFLGEDGKICTLKYKDIEAFIVQHELDHLDGILISSKGNLWWSESSKKGK